MATPSVKVIGVSLVHNFSNAANFAGKPNAAGLSIGPSPSSPTYGILLDAANGTINGCDILNNAVGIAVGNLGAAGAAILNSDVRGNGTNLSLGSSGITPVNCQY